MLKRTRRENEFDALIALRKTQYEKVKDTFCPLLQEVVYFNNKGFYHALRDGRDKYRGQADATMRLNLLPHVRSVVETASRFNRPPQLTSASVSNLNKDMLNYEIVKAVKIRSQRKEIVVVLRRVGKGRLHYYSVRYRKKQNRP